MAFKIPDDVTASNVYPFPMEHRVKVRLSTFYGLNLIPSIAGKSFVCHNFEIEPRYLNYNYDISLILWMISRKFEKGFHSTVTTVFFWSQGQKLKRKHQKNNLVDSDVRQCLFKRKLSLERELSSIGFWIQSTLCMV